MNLQSVYLANNVIFVLNNYVGSSREYYKNDPFL